MTYGKYASELLKGVSYPLVKNQSSSLHSDALSKSKICLLQLIQIKSILEKIITPEHKLKKIITNTINALQGKLDTLNAIKSTILEHAIQNGYTEEDAKNEIDAGLNSVIAPEVVRRYKDGKLPAHIIRKLLPPKLWSRDDNINELLSTIKHNSGQAISHTIPVGKSTKEDFYQMLSAFNTLYSCLDNRVEQIEIKKTIDNLYTMAPNFNIDHLAEVLDNLAKAYKAVCNYQKTPIDADSKARLTPMKPILHQLAVKLISKSKSGDYNSAEKQAHQQFMLFLIKKGLLFYAYCFFYYTTEPNTVFANDVNNPERFSIEIPN